MELEVIKNKAKHIYETFQPLIKAIYLGGSGVSGFINNPHDVDFITFTDSKENLIKLNIFLKRYKKLHPDLFEDNECWVQIRLMNHTKLTYWSYLYSNMQLLIGEPNSFSFDPINNIDTKNQYIKYLKEHYMYHINKKRIYHFYRGYLLVTKGTYDLTEEEIENLNMLHDQKPEDYEKIQKLQNELKLKIRRLEYASTI